MTEANYPHVERRIERLMLPVETQIMMCDDQNDLLLLAVGMLRKAILIFDNQYNVDGRKAVIESFNK
jgi:hypothetical protein